MKSGVDELPAGSQRAAAFCFCHHVRSEGEIFWGLAMGIRVVKPTELGQFSWVRYSWMFPLKVGDKNTSETLAYRESKTSRGKLACVLGFWEVAQKI